MTRYLVIFTCIFLGFLKTTKSQDVFCNISIRTDNVQTTNMQIFEDLENSLNMFINQRKWLQESVLSQEKINCNLNINITTYNIDQFSATVNITSSRPVFGTTYNTPMFNHFDTDWDFAYVQSQTLEYDYNSHLNDLTALVGFYINIIIGLDLDAQAPEGGNLYFNRALQIRNNASNIAGWRSVDGKGGNNRFYLIENILDDRFRTMRVANYLYHFKGLDIMRTKIDDARKKIFEAMENIAKTHQLVPNAMLIRIFFNAKREELINIFKKADPGMKNKIIELLSKMDPANASRYQEIKKD
jgi:hypothetical protein